jgi:hypothetical protein
VKVLAYILTAATVLIGADVFVMSGQPADATRVESGPIALHGGTGMPPPPPDLHGGSGMPTPPPDAY